MLLLQVCVRTRTFRTDAIYFTVDSPLETALRLVVLCFVLFYLRRGLIRLLVLV